MHYKGLFLLTLLFLVFTGCEDNEEVTYNLTTDAYIRGIEINGKIVYAPILIAEVSASTVSLAATDDKAKKYILEPYWNNNLTYRWLPANPDYTDSPVEKNKFNFLAIADNAKNDTIKQTAEISLANVPAAFKILKHSYNKATSELTVTWENKGADTYLIQVSGELDEKPIFQSINFEITKEDTEVSALIKPSTMKWFGTPNSTTTYILSVHAFNFANGQKDIGGEFMATQSIVLK